MAKDQERKVAALSLAAAPRVAAAPVATKKRKFKFFRVYRYF